MIKDIFNAKCVCKNKKTLFITCFYSRFYINRNIKLGGLTPNISLVVWQFLETLFIIIIIIELFIWPYWVLAVACGVLVEACKLLAAVYGV